MPFAALKRMRISRAPSGARELLPWRTTMIEARLGTPPNDTSITPPLGVVPEPNRDLDLSGLLPAADVKD